MATPLLDWIEGVLLDPQAREAFLRDPDKYAEEHGFSELSSRDVHEALTLIVDARHDQFDHGAQLPPPQRTEPSDDHNGAHYLRGYLHDHRDVIDQNRTELDNSIEQDIDTAGPGHFHQFIDNDPLIAPGEETVVTDDPGFPGEVTTGRGNVIGSGNQAVTGDDNTTAFGAGGASSTELERASVDEGGALSVAGNAAGYAEDDDTSALVRNSGDGDTAVNTAGDQSYAGQYLDQSSQDASTEVDYTESTESDSHNDINSHNNSHYEDSHDVVAP